MPSKNTIKIYVENGYYHLYNRGVDKREIFQDKQDCSVFLHYLKFYLSPVEKIMENGLSLEKAEQLTVSKDIDLLSFALMPNHFHLQVKQYPKYGIEKFTRRLLTAYVQYFNYKYKRSGVLFEGTYKAKLIKSDNNLLYLSSYIHKNSMSIKNSKINFSEFSSYPYYLGEKNAVWIKPAEILSFFKTKKGESSYQEFVEGEDSKSFLNGLTLEDDYI